MRRIRKGDDVIVIAGRDKGKRGNVLKITSDHRALVDNVNLVKRHTRGNPNTGETGGIMEKEAPIQLSNLALYNPASKKGERVGFRVLADGKKVRYFKSNDEVIVLA